MITGILLEFGLPTTIQEVLWILVGVLTVIIGKGIWNFVQHILKTVEGSTTIAQEAKDAVATCQLEHATETKKEITAASAITAKLEEFRQTAEEALQMAESAQERFQKLELLKMEVEAVKKTAEIALTTSQENVKRFEEVNRRFEETNTRISSSMAQMEKNILGEIYKLGKAFAAFTGKDPSVEAV